MLGSLSQGFCRWALWFSHCKRFALANFDNFFVTGGTFALYSLLCRHAKLSLILNQQTADVELSTYKLEQPPETPRGLWVRKLLEKYEILRHGLLIIVLLGTCMVIGDGVLTPAISGNRPPTDGFWNCSLNLYTSRSTSTAGLLNVAIYWSFHVYLPSAVIRTM